MAMMRLGCAPADSNSGVSGRLSGAAGAVLENATAAAIVALYPALRSKVTAMLMETFQMEIGDWLMGCA
jgi:hypothetical protein